VGRNFIEAGRGHRGFIDDSLTPSRGGEYPFQRCSVIDARSIVLDDRRVMVGMAA